MSIRRIWVIYRRPLGLSERVLQGISRCGEFTHCEVYCPDLMHEGMVGCTFTNFSMCAMMRTRECLPSYRQDRDKYMYHAIDLERTQFDKFTAWNDVQVVHNCKYNYSDVCRQMIPTVIAARITSEVDTTKEYHRKLYCSQAVVLALRASLASDHRVCKALKDITSRLSTPSIVADHLSVVLGPPYDLPLIDCRIDCRM
jgi:hypothetical protein